jgi:hypothetical protein
MPQRPDSRSPQERLRRSRSNARMWANLSDQQRAYRLEQLRLAREKLRTIREKARTERKKKGIVTVPLLSRRRRDDRHPRSGPEGPLAPKPRIPSALALHLATTLHRLWYQEPGHERPHAADSARTSPSAGRRIDAFPAGTTGTLNLPPGRGPGRTVSPSRPTASSSR